MDLLAQDTDVKILGYSHFFPKRYIITYSSFLMPNGNAGVQICYLLQAHGISLHVQLSVADDGRHVMFMRCHVCLGVDLAMRSYCFTPTHAKSMKQ